MIMGRYKGLELGLELTLLSMNVLIFWAAIVESANADGLDILGI